MIFCYETLCAQTFSSGIVLGLNASQVDGDQLAGYDKLGICAGLKGAAQLGDKIDLNVEFLYSERGSAPDLLKPNSDVDIKIRLQYLELPVYISYMDWWQEEEEYYKIHLRGGLSVGRLIKASTFDHFNEGDADLDNLVDEFNETDVSFLLGVSFYTSPNFGISVRYTRSVNLLLDSGKKMLSIDPLRSYFISFRGEYIF
jgi:hypothetical protein